MAADYSIPLMVGIAEASKLTGLSYNTLRQMCLNNEIVYIRSGAKKSKYLINMNKLTEHLNQGNNNMEGENINGSRS